ncbi:MAG: globin domain-containing protein [Methylophaga sp.]|nr:globin domain-containing protein [Methylophaga sp.]
MTTPHFPDKGQIGLIESSFAPLLAIKPSIAEQFYQRLAAEHPEIFALFKDAEPAGQQQKLLAAMTLLVTNLNQPALLESYFQELGERHRQYAVSNIMFKPFTDTWLTVVDECLSEAMVNTESVSAAWRQLMAYVTAQMQYLPADNAPTIAEINDDAINALSVHIADLLAQQQRLIIQLSLTASRDSAAQHLLSDLAELRLLSSALQSALNKPLSS